MVKWLLCRTCDFTQHEYAAVYKQLSPSRKAHIDTFTNPAARQCSLAGELLLRRLLQQEGIPAVPERKPGGQPYLSGDAAFVSISHCDDRVVCAVSDEPVGIDIEKIRPIRTGMAEKVCTEEELSYVSQDTGRFFEVWTAKEAYFKMLGTGITDLKAVNTLALQKSYITQDGYLICLMGKEKR